MNRQYISSLSEAEEFTRNVLIRLDNGIWETDVSLDIETAPIEFMDAWPQTTRDETSGKRKSPSKTNIRLGFIELTERLFDSTDTLRQLGVEFPRKKTKLKGEARGDLATQGPGVNGAWERMRQTLATIPDQVLGDLSVLFPADYKIIPLWKELLNCSIDKDRVGHSAVVPGLDPYTTDIFLLQFTFVDTWGEKSDYIFNCLRLEEYRPWLRNLLEEFDKREVLIIGQNIKFDLKHILHQTGYLYERVYDTAVAERILTLGLKVSRSLDALAEKYLGVKLDKGVRETFIGNRSLDPTPEQIEYSYWDTNVLPDIKARQIGIAGSRGQFELILDYCKLVAPTAYWEYSGYLIDQDSWLQIASEVQERRDRYAKLVVEFLTPEGYTELLFDEGEEPDEEEEGPFRPSQTAVVKGLLSDRLGIPVVSISKDPRAELEREYRKINGGETIPFFRNYELWSKNNKAYSTYGPKFLWYIHPVTGRVHPNFSIAGTDTSRYSCSNPNLLNIPTQKEEEDVDFRGAFLAGEGLVWGNADYSGEEQRIAADVTLDPVLLALFEVGGDSHSVTAALMFHLERADVPEPTVIQRQFKNGTLIETINVLQVPRNTTFEDFFAWANSDQVISYVTKKGTRATAKVVGFLFYFGGSAFGLARKTGAPTAQAEAFWDAYLGTFAVLAEKFQEFAQYPFKNKETWADGKQYGYSPAYGGLRRWFQIPQPPSPNDFGLDFAGKIEFERAQKDYKRQLGTVRRAAQNMPTQGGNARVLTDAIILLWERGKPFGIRPKLSIYDELLVEVPERYLSKPNIPNGLIEQCMVEAGERWTKNVATVVDCNKLSTVWTKG